MFEIGKHKFVPKAIIAGVSLAFAVAAFSAAVNSARIIPRGKVSIIKDGRVVGEISKEAPLPEGSLLRCEAQCTVRMDDFYMLTEPETTFSVTPQAAANQLTVQQGTAYYSLSETSPPLQITTPSGNASIREFSVTGSELKGYVRVSNSRTEIGVIEGGTMTVETSSGEMAIPPNRQITIASVNKPNPSAAASGEGGGSGTLTDIGLGAAQAGVVIGGGYAVYAIDRHYNSDSDRSPSSP